MNSESTAKTYEERFANAIGSGVRAFSFWKGRVAFSAILEALEIGAGAEVILPAFTCVVVPNAIMYRGAAPVYADIEGSTFNLHSRSVEAQITRRTRAIVVQHTFGIPADMDDLMSLVHGKNIAIIEDCAHALGSKYHGRLVGTFGQAAFFSSQWSKPYSTGLGGMAVTGDEQVAKNLSKIQRGYLRPDRVEVGRLRLQRFLHQRFFTPRVYWIAQAILTQLSHRGVFIGSSESDELECSEPEGYKKGMSALQARWGLRELVQLGRNQSRRIRLARLYDELLSEAGFQPLSVAAETVPVLVRYPLLVKKKREILTHARKRHLEIGSWFEAVLHPQGCPLERAGYALGKCPVGEEIADHVINLPTHSRVKEAEALRVVGFLKDMRERGIA